jgi:Ni,Fe-hydrogenase III component G
MANAISLPHKCPNCKTTEANSEKELRDKFGFRTINLPNGKIQVRSQSWCKKCR